MAKTQFQHVSVSLVRYKFYPIQIELTHNGYFFVPFSVKQIKNDLDVLTLRATCTICPPPPVCLSLNLSSLRVNKTPGIIEFSWFVTCNYFKFKFSLRDCKRNYKCCFIHLGNTDNILMWVLWLVDFVQQKQRSQFTEFRMENDGISLIVVQTKI